jgi:hypothetical protein
MEGSSALTKACFCRVRRLAWCNDPESYAGGSLAAVRVTLAGQVKGEHPDKERYPGLPGWGLGRWAGTSSPGKRTHRLNSPYKVSENLKVGQWEDGKQWSLGVGQGNKSFETVIYIYIYMEHIFTAAINKQVVFIFCRSVGIRVC